MARSSERIITSQDGAKLSVMVTEPSQGCSGGCAFVMLPPHPLLGGSIDQLGPLAEALATRGHLVARMSYRGTGGSKGGSVPVLGSDRDAWDAVDVAKHCVGKGEGAGNDDGRGAIVVGYSFGACIAGRIRDEREIAGVVMLAYPYGTLWMPPIGTVSALSMRPRHAHYVRMQMGVPPSLLIQPPRDEITAMSSFHRLENSLPEDSRREVSVLSTSCGHFDGPIFACSEIAQLIERFASSSCSSHAI